MLAQRDAHRREAQVNCEISKVAARRHDCKNRVENKIKIADKLR